MSEHAPHTNGHANGTAEADHFPPGYWDRFRFLSAVTGVVGVVAFVLLSLLRPAIDGVHAADGTTTAPPIRQLMLPYLVAVTFWMSVSVGAIVLLLIQYLTGGKWGILLRRILEANSRTLPWFVLLLVPIVASWFIPSISPSWWVYKSIDEVGPEAAGKMREWLFPSGAAIRMVIYLGIWMVMMYLLNHWGAQDEENPNGAAKGWLQYIAGPGLIVHALTMTFFVTDLVMSLEESWSSTMFPVIFGTNQFLSAYVLAVAVLLTLSQGPLKHVVTQQHKVDLGSFMLAFTCFWTYVSFSQFMLIWVGNLPEEIPYYLRRASGGWLYVGYTLFGLHFVLPFMLLLFRDIKYSPVLLRWTSLLLFVLCMVDVVWYIEPSVNRETQMLFPFQDIAALAAVGGLWGWSFSGQIMRGTMLPTHEKHLLEEHHDHE